MPCTIMNKKDSRGVKLHVQLSFAQRICIIFHTIGFETKTKSLLCSPSRLAMEVTCCMVVQEKYGILVDCIHG